MARSDVHPLLMWWDEERRKVENKALERLRDEVEGPLISLALMLFAVIGYCFVRCSQGIVCFSIIMVLSLRDGKNC